MTQNQSPKSGRVSSFLISLEIRVWGIWDSWRLLRCRGYVLASDLEGPRCV